MKNGDKKVIANRVIALVIAGILLLGAVATLLMILL